MSKKALKNHKESTWNKVKNNKEIIITVMALLITVFAIIGTSYAFFSNTLTSKNKQDITVGTFQITYQEGNTIKLTNASPISDNEGLQINPYTFSITNTGSLNANYKIKLFEDNTNPLTKLDRTKIKLAYTKENINIPPRLLSEGQGLLIDEGIITSNQVINYKLRIWLDEKTGNEDQGKQYSAKIIVENVQ